MKNNDKGNYMLRYANLVQLQTDDFEHHKKRSKWTIMAIWLVFVAICILVWPNFQPKPMFHLFALFVGASVLVYIANAGDSNQNYKQGIIKAIIADEHPDVEYAPKLGSTLCSCIAETFGSHIEPSGEDCFTWQAGGYNVTGCEATLRNNWRKHSNVVFHGGVWRIDLGHEFTPHDLFYAPCNLNAGKLFKHFTLLHEEDDCWVFATTREAQYRPLPPGVWEEAVKASKNDDSLRIIASGQYLYIAIPHADDLLEQGGSITEESLARAASEIDYFIDMPSRLMKQALHHS